MNERDKMINSIINDNSIETPNISRTERLLEEEIIRDNPDFELIDELTKLLSELKGIELDNINADNERAEIKRKATKIRRKRLNVRKALGIAASFVLICTLLYRPLNASGLIDKFPSLKIRNGHLTIDFKDSADPDKKAGTDIDSADPYSIKRIAAVYGMDVFTPTYMPEGEFTFSNKSGNIDGVQQCCFNFYWKEEGKGAYMCKNIEIVYQVTSLDKINVFDVDDHSSGMEVNPMDQTVVCGIDAYIFSFYDPATECDVYTMRFYQKTTVNDGIMTTVLCQNLTEEEVYAVYNSFK